MGTPHTWGPLEIGDGYFGILSEFLKGLNDFFKNFSKFLIDLVARLVVVKRGFTC